jgi:hypothetical protein
VLVNDYLDVLEEEKNWVWSIDIIFWSWGLVFEDYIKLFMKTHSSNIHTLNFQFKKTWRWISELYMIIFDNVKLYLN